ncbi:MAG TPA: leucyl aminopeptidase [Caulobacteraceae bacterium]|jgi:leucyl aminopeptidase
MKVEFVKAASEAAIVVVFVHEDRVMTPAAKAYDRKTKGALARAIGAGRFTGAKGQTLALTAPAGVDNPQILAVGLGAKEKTIADLVLEAAAGAAYHAGAKSGFTAIAYETEGLSADQAARIGFAARLASYRFDRYRTTEKPEAKPSIATVQVITDAAPAARKAYGPLSAVADGVEFTRDLVSEPANVLYPEEFAKRCKALEKLGLQVEVLTEAQMAKLGMRTLLAVGQGSSKESRLVVMKWMGGAKTAAPVAFVGKGVCFDSGGLSLKPPGAMEDMKWDMGGGGAVAGLMCALAGRKAKTNVVGVIGLVENMPDGNAQRPGDVVVTMSGQTVEVLNTDAEGRLVLADALWYTQGRFKPRFMVDLATLTGAMIVALGNDFAGIFSNNDELSDAILAASAATGERTWRMPLPDDYDRLIETPIADVKNTSGPAGGSITAALFLRKFVNNTPWAHLDIAPVAWKKDSKVPTVPDGATGFGVRLLDRLVADKFEG